MSKLTQAVTKPSGVVQSCLINSYTVLVLEQRGPLCATRSERTGQRHVYGRLCIEDTHLLRAS